MISAESRKQVRRWQLERKAAKEAFAILSEGGLAAAEKLPANLSVLARVEALLARSWTLRYENVEGMTRLAYLAVLCARQLDAREYGAQLVDDLRCAAHAQLGNSYRIAERFAAAEREKANARAFFERGTRNELLEVRLLDLEASLDADLRRFGVACARQERVFLHYLKHGAKHLAGRALIKLGLFTTYGGAPEEGIRLLRESRDLVDVEREPALAYMIMHNLIWSFLAAGRFNEAERQLFLLRPYQRHSGGRINLLRLRWMEGRIDGGLGRLERAERILREVMDGFQEAKCTYDKALASMDLAAILVRQERQADAAAMAASAQETFVALGISHEGIQAVGALLVAFLLKRATPAMAEEVAAFLRRLDNDPAARFEGRSWRFDR